MRKMKPGLILIILLMLLMGLSSCDLFVSFFGTTIDDRIDAFNDDTAAGNISKLYTHFHSDTADYTSMKNDPGTYWFGSVFESGAQIINYSVSGTTVTGTETGSDQSCVVEMKREGLDYKMNKVYVGGVLEVKKVE